MAEMESKASANAWSTEDGAVQEDQSPISASPLAQVVFDVPELLELILLQLPPKTVLFNAIRVSHQWKDAIDDSPNIQEMLFFTTRHGTVGPIKMVEVTLVTTEGVRFPFYHGPLRMNPMLPSMHPASDRIPTLTNLSKNLWYFATYADAEHADDDSNKHIPFTRAQLLCLKRGGLRPPYPRHPPIHVRGASWRRMHLTDPSCSTAYVSVGTTQPRTRVEFIVQDKKGIKQGLLEDLIHNVLNDIRGEWISNGLIDSNCESWVWVELLVDAKRGISR